MSEPRGSRDYVRVELAENISLGGGNFILRFHGCQFLAEAKAGQFVMLRAQGWGSDPLLPRAFSLLSVSVDGVADILVKAVGKASSLLEYAQVGARCSLLGPLGNGFADPESTRPTWLIAGGVGLAPLLMVARRAKQLGIADLLTLFYGGRTAVDLVLLKDINDTGVKCVLATEDGSAGERGFVTAPFVAELDRFCSSTEPSEQPVLFACGPDPMLKAIAHIACDRELDCFLSLEGEMACGVGACLVCAVPCTGDRPFQYACVDGPVFSRKQLSDCFGTPRRMESARDC